MFISIQILTGPVTTKMKEEALKPFTKAMIEAVCETLGEQFREHTQQMTGVIKETALKEDVCETLEEQFREHTQQVTKVLKEEAQKTSNESHQQLVNSR